MTCGIYIITNTVNNKSYIGQSINIEKRWQQHKCSNERKPLYRAFKKHGLDKFRFEILVECKQEELDQNEIQCIAEYGSYGKGGYNLTSGGKRCPANKDIEAEINSSSLEDTLKDALEHKDLRNLLWSLLGKAIDPNTPIKDRMGSTAFSILVKSLADIEKNKSPGDLINKSETEEWEDEE